MVKGSSITMDRCALPGEASAAAAAAVLLKRLITSILVGENTNGSCHDLNA